MTHFYEIVFNSAQQPNIGQRVSQVFTKKAAAIRRANRLAKEKYVSMVQVWAGGVGGMLIHERHHN